MQEKTTALVSAQVGRGRAEEQAQQAQEQLRQVQAGVQRLQAQLRQAKQRSEAGVRVPVAHCQQLLLQLERLQQRYDVLEREHAELQHRVPPAGTSNGSSSCTDRPQGSDAAPRGSDRAYSPGGRA